MYLGWDRSTLSAEEAIFRSGFLSGVGCGGEGETTFVAPSDACPSLLLPSTLLFLPLPHPTPSSTRTCTMSASAGGLSRRRGAPGGSALNDDDDRPISKPSSPNPGSSSGGPSRAQPSNPSSSANGSQTPTRGSGGTLQGRGKVAYDPRDFEDSGEKQGVPRLTLLEEILLLGLKDNQVSSCSLQVLGGRRLGADGTSLYRAAMGLGRERAIWLRRGRGAGGERSLHCYSDARPVVPRAADR